MASKHFPQSDNLRGRNTDRLDNLVVLEAQHFGHRHRRANGARRGGDVPADVVMLRPDSQAKLTLDLDPCDQRSEKGLARDVVFGRIGARVPFCGCEERAGDGTCWVDDGVEVRVVVVVDVRGDAVEECGVLRVGEGVLAVA